jgi:bifunctional non-homologous end joining protein LigD
MRTGRKIMTKVTLTHLDKIFWPKEGFTKGDVIRYYERVADVILPYLRHRPMVLNRHPNGIKGASFFQKNVDPKRLPSYAKSVSIRARSTGRNVHYIVCDNKATLLYLANLGCIELHPWLSRVGRLNNPDFLVIDLDPHGTPFPQVVTVAKMARKIIAEAGGKSFVKTSGKTGIHIYVPLRGAHEFAYVRSIARLICKAVNKRLPKITSFAHRPAGRGRIYLDYARNAIGQTAAAPYSLRAWPGATVSTPLEWSELTQSRRPGQFTMRTVFRRLNGKGDVWAAAFRKGVNLRRMERKLEGILDGLKRRAR